MNQFSTWHTYAKEIISSVQSKTVMAVTSATSVVEVLGATEGHT